MNKILSLLLIGLCLIGCKSNATINEETQSVQESEMSDEWTPAEPAMQEPISITFGDFEGMSAFSKKCQNGEYADGQIVTIDGVLSINPMGSVSVGQRNEAKGEYIGTKLVVSDWTEDNFPPEDTRVRVNAKLKRNEQFWFLYMTAEPADIEIVSDR